MNDETLSTNSTPPPRTDQSLHAVTAVLMPGLAVCAVVLIALYFLGHWFPDFYVMGWYVYFIIPAGAILVGALSGSGYGLFSWMRGVRANARLLWVVAGIQTVAYGMGQYQEFLHIDPRYDDGSRVPFFAFFDYVTQSFTWSNKGGTQSDPLGVWGYGVRCLELGGFVLGGIAPLLWLGRRTYCEACQHYHRTTYLGVIAAGVQPPAIKMGAAKAKFEADDAAVFQSIEGQLHAVRTAAQQGDVEALVKTLDRGKKGRRAAAKLTRRIEVSLDHCPSCHNGFLAMQLLEGQSANPASVETVPLTQQSVVSFSKE